MKKMSEHTFPELMAGVISDATYTAGGSSFTHRLARSGYMKELLFRGQGYRKNQILGELLAIIHRTHESPPQTEVMNTWSRLINSILREDDGHDDTTPYDSLMKSVTRARAYLKAEAEKKK